MFATYGSAFCYISNVIALPCYVQVVVGRDDCEKSAT